MRSKNILSIAAFIVAFGVSTVLASFFIPIPQPLPVDYSVSSVKPTSCFARHKPSAAAEKISVFISQDSAGGDRRDQKIADLTGESKISLSDYAEITKEYVDEANNLNAKNLPRDFQAAWREHLKAWRDYSQFLNRTVRSSPDDAPDIEDYQDVSDFHDQEINQTYNEVLEIGESYGASVR